MAKKDIWTLVVMRADEGDIDLPMSYAHSYYSAKEAEKDAMKLLKDLKSWEDGEFTVFVMSGEYEDENGDVFGEPDSTWEMSTSEIKASKIKADKDIGKVLNEKGISWEEGIKQGLIDENSYYTDKAKKMAYDKWLKENKGIIEEINQAWSQNLPLNNYDDIYQFYLNMSNSDRQQYRDIYYAVSNIELKLPMIEEEFSEEEEEMIRETVNYGKLSEEKIYELDLELSQLSENVYDQGKDMFYNIKKNDKGETIVNFEGNLPVWQFKDDIK